MEVQSEDRLCSFRCDGKRFSLVRGQVNINSLGQIFRLRPESIIVVDSKSRRTFIPGIGGNIDICTDEGEFEVEGEPLATGLSTPTGSALGSSSTSSSIGGVSSLFGWSSRPSVSRKWSSSRSPFHARLSAVEPYASPAKKKDVASRRVVLQLVKFDGKKKSGGGRSFNSIETFTINIPTVGDPDFTTRKFTEMVQERVKEWQIEEPIVVTDGFGCPISGGTSPDQVGPSRRFLVATARNYNKHFPTESVKEKLTATPEKPHQPGNSKRRFKFAVSSDSEDLDEDSPQNQLQLRIIRNELKKSTKTIIDRLDAQANTLAAILDSFVPTAVAHIRPSADTEDEKVTVAASPVLSDDSSPLPDWRD